MSCPSLLVLIQAPNQISDIQKGTIYTEVACQLFIPYSEVVSYCLYLPRPGTWDMYRTTIVLQGNNTCTTLVRGSKWYYIPLIK